MDHHARSQNQGDQKVKIFLLALSLFAASAMSAESRETKTTIGKWYIQGQGQIRADVFANDKGVGVQILAHDPLVIRHVFFRVSIDDAKQLRSILDESIAEAEKQLGEGYE